MEHKNKLIIQKYEAAPPKKSSFDRIFFWLTLYKKLFYSLQESQQVSVKIFWCCTVSEISVAEFYTGHPVSSTGFFKIP